MAACNFLDKILISKYFKGTGVGALVIYSAIFGFIVVPLAYLFPADFFSPGWHILIMIGAGIGYMLGVIPYLYALRQEDTSTVIPIFQTIPVFSFILGYFFLNEFIEISKLWGIALLIIGSVIISTELSGGRIRFNWKTVSLMLLASAMFSLSNFLFKFMGVDYGFIITCFWNYIGYAIFGIFLLFIRTYRWQFLSTFRQNKLTILSLNSFNEIMAVGGAMLQNYAILLAPLALVVSVGGFQPVFAIIYGVILTLFFPKLLKEDISMKRIGIKIFSIVLIFIGGYLIQ